MLPNLYQAALYPGSRRPRPLAVDECASVWPGCRPTGTASVVPRALPVGLRKVYGEHAVSPKVTPGVCLETEQRNV